MTSRMTVALSSCRMARAPRPIDRARYARRCSASRAVVGQDPRARRRGHGRRRPGSSSTTRTSIARRQVRPRASRRCTPVRPDGRRRDPRFTARRAGTGGRRRVRRSSGSPSGGRRSTNATCATSPRSRIANTASLSYGGSLSRLSHAVEVRDLKSLWHHVAILRRLLDFDISSISL